jgi:hypothetical protein
MRRLQYIALLVLLASLNRQWGHFKMMGIMIKVYLISLRRRLQPIAAWVLLASLRWPLKMLVFIFIKMLVSIFIKMLVFIF